MSQLWLVTALAAGLVFSWSPPGAAAGKRPNLRFTIPRITAPAIDGDSTDIAWTEASLKDGKVVVDLTLGGRRRVDLPRIVYAGYDSESLYFCVINFCEDPSKLKGGPRRMFWQGDDIEARIQTDPASPAYFLLGVTPENVAVLKCCGGTVEPDEKLVRTQSRRDGIRWVCEIAIPFAALKLPPPEAGAAWRMNITGRQNNGERLGAWIAWNPTYGSFDDVERFATVTFGE